jgi:hypothetical protein
MTDARYQVQICTRAVKKTGAPCQEHVRSWHGDIGLPDPRSCRRHMTKEERAALNDYEQRQYEEIRRIIAQGPDAIRAVGAAAFAVPPSSIRLPLPDPACWYWPAPETCTFKDEEAASDFLRWWHCGMCAICGDRGDLVDDHDHKTGLVRGRLCRFCNGKEGHADDEGVFGKYRQRNPASILGVKVRYWSSWTGYAEPEPILTPGEAAEADQRIRAAVDRIYRPSA